MQLCICLFIPIGMIPLSENGNLPSILSTSSSFWAPLPPCYRFLPKLLGKQPDNELGHALSGFDAMKLCFTMKPCGNDQTDFSNIAIYMFWASFDTTLLDICHLNL